MRLVLATEKLVVQGRALVGFPLLLVPFLVSRGRYVDALLRDLRDMASENESLRRELDIQRAINSGSVAQIRR